MLTSFTPLSLAFAVAFFLCALLTLALSRIAPRLGLVDNPGGRKDHPHAVPLVGGVAILASLLLLAPWLGGPQMPDFLLALSLVTAVGLWDDARGISPRLKFAIQILAALVMIASGVVLHSVGDILGWRPIGLWVFAVPATAFAVVGVVNAINMIDGMDGLCGSISCIALAWYAAAAAASGIEGAFAIAVVLSAATAGFLVFNLRHAGQRRARAFLGDAGSLMLGFALAWLAIDLTQRGSGALAPIAALWVVMLPLADCVSVMARRLARREDPFIADRQHIHHYLLARGLSPGQCLAILAFASAAFGAIGYFGWRLGVPEAWLFWPFFFGFFAYHFWIGAAWKALAPRERRDALDEQPARALG